MAIDRFLVANLLRIGGLDEFEPFRKHLREQREYWRDAAETQVNDVPLRQAQGRAQAYKDILEILDKAPALSEKYRD